MEIDSTTEGENPFLFYVERVSKDPLRWSIGRYMEELDAIRLKNVKILKKNKKI